MGFEALTAASLSLFSGILILFGYITNNTFPQPLSEEEEAKYLQLLEQGEEDARNVLVERNLRLVAHIAKKFDGALDDSEDLISIGTIGLIKAIKTYDLKKGTRLATYAARCIENEILMHLRATKKNKAEVSLYDPIGVDKEGNEITLIDILGTDPDVISEMVEIEFEKEKLLKKMDKLTKRERNVIQSRFGLAQTIRKTQSEIAKMLGISRSYVSRIEKKAISKLFKELELPGTKTP